jgi:hypothetical protein
MPWFAIVLRIVLSVALILNGFGSAMAATHMHLENASTVADARTHTPTQARDDSAAAPCHDSSGIPDSGSKPQDEGETGTAKSSADLGCCASGLCSCKCVHQGQALFAPTLCSQLALEHSADVRTMTSAHASPALPHLIRPPIV